VFRTKFVKTGASCISYKQERLTHLGSPHFLFVEPVLLILLVFCITVYHCVSFRPVSCLSYVASVCIVHSGLPVSFSSTFIIYSKDDLVYLLY
jgi:glucan phosphoethanolaminetransferase (alkaline phosphatase superfamily)